MWKATFATESLVMLRTCALRSRRFYAPASWGCIAVQNSKILAWTVEEAINACLPTCNKEWLQSRDFSAACGLHRWSKVWAVRSCLVWEWQWEWFLEGTEDETSATKWWKRGTSPSWPAVRPGSDVSLKKRRFFDLDSLTCRQPQHQANISLINTRKDIGKYILYRWNKMQGNLFSLQFHR